MIKALALLTAMSLAVWAGLALSAPAGAGILISYIALYFIATE